MTMSVIHTKVYDRARQNLRLDPDIWTAIDSARLRRAGNVSRNTWVTEAIVEKLAREQNNGAPDRIAGGGDV